LFVGALAISPAQAADLGGDCCADLEERVAELEATTVRKSTRVVSVQLYGQINKALMVWDDGVDSDVYVVDSDISSTRFGLRGSGTIKPGWTAGFRLEMQLESATSIGVSQDYDALAGDDAGTGFSTRRASLYIESAQLGRVTMGLTSLATDDLVYTYLGSVNVTGAEFFGGGLRLRTSDGGFLGGAGVKDTIFQDNPSKGIGNEPGLPDSTAVSISDVATDTDIGRDDAIRYDSPSLFGFIFSAAWGESDVADVALRFKKEWNSIQMVAAAGYRYDGDNNNDFDGKGSLLSDTETFILAGGLKHTPSGLFLNGVWVQQDRDDLDRQVGTTKVGVGSQTVIDDSGAGDTTGSDFNPESATGNGVPLADFNSTITRDLTAPVDAGAAAAVEDEATYYSIFGGIERNWTGHGLTSIFGRYTVYEDFGAGAIGDFDGDGFADDVLTGSDVDVWGFGIEQNFDSAALEIYAHFNYFEFDDVEYQTTRVTSVTDSASAADGRKTTVTTTTDSGKASIEDAWVGYLGTRIKF